MTQSGSAFLPAGGWRLVAADGGLGNPEAAPADGGSIVAQPNLPNGPPQAGTGSIVGDVVAIAGLILAVVVAILVRSSVLKAQVAKMKPYDEARNAALIAGLVSGFVVAALAIAVRHYALEG